MRGVIRYDSPQGKEIFLKELANSYSKDFGFKVEKSNIVFINGIAQGLKLLGEYVDEIIKEDEFVLETKPTFVEWRQISKKRTNIIDTLEGFDFSKDKLSKLLITADSLNALLVRHSLDKKEHFNKIKCFYLINPTNPIGQYITPKEWEKIIPLLQKYPDALIVVDEAYADVTFEEEFISLIKVAPYDIKKRLIILRSASKAFSLAGERIGVVISMNELIINYITDKQFQNQLNVNLRSQCTFTTIIKHVVNNPVDKRYAVTFL